MTARQPRLTDEERYRRSILEDDLLTSIVQWADLRGWLIHHDRRSDLAKQQGDTGFPDLVLARDQRVIFAELKKQGENLTRDQMAWLLAIVGQANERPVTEARLWRPSDLDAAIEILR